MNHYHFIISLEFYHSFHNVIGPSDFSWSLTSSHALPVLVNEWYDILHREIKTVNTLNRVLLVEKLQ